MSASTAGADLASIGRRALPFLVAGGVVLILTETRLYALAWGILAVSIVYALMYGRGASFLRDIDAILKGGKR